ncbi:ABC transporter ATP-binding protein [Dyadobacter sandarakinus]|uniref:ABC transporter ATP-binding protein n=1 Tax=Dyadobacter sandarakinus TaxID=2747268 RepID=A0ABX7IBS6_9BACT|nr:ABC transporter ATP-binding protein [Dyadobacter sandarakinus]QRR03278.1 ABC transporter ATP-binding protein [Dyadobacter sandarakinus]
MNRLSLALETRQLSVGYRQKGAERIVAGKLSLDLWPGQLVCLLGANGSGKSTLMRTLAGLLPGLGGEILIRGRHLTDLKPAELAKELSVVLTDRLETGNLSAGEVIALGRTPYTGWLGRLSESDHYHINLAIEQAGVASLLTRKIQELSDGERQKLLLARALAQDTGVILLDEPTAHLDLPNRVEMMGLLRELARDSSKAILLSTHELDLALQSADQLWLMGKDGSLAAGAPEDLVLNGAFEAAFAGSGFYFDQLSGTFMVHRTHNLLHFALAGEPRLVFWTQRALERKGYGISLSKNHALRIAVQEENQDLHWILDWKGQRFSVRSMEALLQQIHFLAESTD